MSGPKGGSYGVVETAAQREARMLRAAKADYARAQSEWESAETILSAARAVCGEELKFAPPAAVSDNADSAAYTQAAAELQAAAASAVELARQARERSATNAHATRIARMVERLTAQPKPAGKDRATHASPAPERARESEVDRDLVKQRVGRRLTELAGFDHDTSRVAALIDDIAAAGSQSRIDLILSELDYVIAEVREAAEQAERIRTSRAELAALQARIADIRTATADNIRRRIADLIAGGAEAVPPDVAQAVDAVIQAADTEADRLHVVRVMATALEQLGYNIGPHFSTDLSGAQRTAYARSGSSGYGVKVRMEAGSTRFTAQAVKSDAVLTSVEEDTTAEREFCAAFNQMIELAGRDGVALHADIRVEPGAYSVQQVTDTKLGTVASDQKARAVGAGRKSVKEMRRER